jgi:hypothetical protein
MPLAASMSIENKLLKNTGTQKNKNNSTSVLSVAMMIVFECCQQRI